MDVKRKYPFKLEEMVMVFGSNTAGIHGAGAARYAYEKKGARWGHSYGMAGQSFAIPTKGHEQVQSHKPNPEMKNREPVKLVNVVGNTLPIPVIRRYVDGFNAFAKHHPELHFQVTCIGCGLAGLKHQEIAPLFRDIDDLPNVWFDEKWEPYLNRNAKFWGHG